MTKLARQQTIIELAQEAPLPKQEDLCKVLAKRGFPVTQATLSRDINELRLVRTPEGYTLPNGDAGPDPTPAVSRVVREFVVEVRRAQKWSRLATGHRRRRLGLDGREHGATLD